MGTMEEIKSIFKTMIEDGTVKGKIGGPKENVLVCETMADWCTAGGEFTQRGFSVLSPGGYLAAIDADFGRKALDARVWRYGTVCATSYTKRGFLKYGEVFYSDKYLDIISEEPPMKVAGKKK
jgi:hypothetical protein